MKTKTNYTSKRVVPKGPSPVKNKKSTKPSQKPKGWAIWLTKLAVFALIVVCTVAYTDKKHYFDTTEYYKAMSAKRWDSFYRYSKKTHIDIILLGNSHVYTGVDPALLSNILGCNTMILADASIPVKDNYFVLKEALKVNTPKLVVLETYGMNRVVDETNNRQASIMSFSARKDFSSKLLSMFHLFKIEDYLPSWSPTLRNHSYLLNGKNEVNSSVSLYNKINAQLGQFFQGEYSRYQTGLTDSVINIYDSLGSSWTPNLFDFNETNQYYTKKIIDLCYSKGIQVVLLTIPMYYKNATKYPEWREESLSKFTALNTPWLDLQYNYDTALFTPDCFENAYDPNQHLTVLGAVRVTYKLASFIQSLGIELPNRTQEQTWVSIFCAKNGYIENQIPVPGDVNARLLGENIKSNNAMLTRVILKKDNTLLVQIDKNTLSKEDIPFVRLKIKYQGNTLVAPIALTPILGYETHKNKLYANVLKQDVEILEVVSD